MSPSSPLLTLAHEYSLSNRKAEKWMRQLAPLVKPLISCTEPNEILVFSQTGTLNALPLHALEIEDGKLVLERNPVVYSSNLSILRSCMLRRQQRSLPASPTAIVFGNPSKDREGSTESSTYIAKLFDMEPRIGDRATKEAFLEESHDVDIVHFHGHAHTKRRSLLQAGTDEAAFVSSLLSSEYPPSMSKDAAPLDDSIEFANKAYLEAREIFNLKLRGHISLIACGSGEQTIGVGDEPSGLITALLIAGASSVLGTLWPIADDDGRDFAKLFYKQLLRRPQEAPVINLAEALRSAALHMRDRKMGNQPFHWASFVLHGAWYWKRERKEHE